jgi:spermidine/putrescine transport system substrate-binding protein
VQGAKEVLARTDPKIARNPLVFPPAAIAAKFHPYPALSSKDERAMQEAMAKVTGA